MDMLRESPVGLMSVNGKTGEIMFINQCMVDFFNINHDISMTVSDVFFGVIDSPEILLFDADGQVQFKQTKLVSIKNGVRRLFLVNAKRSDNPQYIIFSFTDITCFDGLSADPLTQLKSRTSFFNELDAILNTIDSNSRIFIIHIDIDNFKLINDSKGHECGDFLLSIVGKRIIDSLHELSGSFAGRVCGDDFLVAFIDHDNDSQQSVEGYVYRLILAISQPIIYLGSSLSISCSAGISVSGRGDNLSDLIINADTALKNAKIKGKDNVVFFQKSMSQLIFNAYELSSSVNESLINNELFFQYQPKICLTTEKVIGFESLMRWKNWNGVIQPNQFIPIVESTGKIIEITEWAVQTILYQISDWLDRGFDVPMISINVSPQSLISNRLVNILSQTLEITQVPVNKLCIELIESTFIYDHVPVKKNLNDIIKMGIKLSLDDFGTGYSSMTLLKEYDFSEIKIDRGFITGIHSCATNQAIVRAIAQLGSDLGKAVVAEGIESAEQMRLSRDLGCDIGQGYYFYRPLYVNDVEKIFESGDNPQFGLIPLASSLLR